VPRDITEVGLLLDAAFYSVPHNRSGNFAMLAVIRRASSIVSTPACRAIVSSSRAGQRLSVGVAHTHVTAFNAIGNPWRREAAGVRHHAEPS
jgi:hypothetical protein